MSRRMFDKQSTKLKRRALKRNQTYPEKILWSKVRNRQLAGLKFRRQVGVGEYIVDFYSAEIKLAIEVDGDSHFTDEAIEYDKKRTQFLETLGIKVVRFNNDDVMINIESVLEEILRVVGEVKSG